MAGGPFLFVSVDARGGCGGCLMVIEEGGLPQG